MIRWLVRIGALYVAYKFGEEVGRAQARVDLRLRPQPDYESTPTARNEEEFGEPI
ncbi:MULTISPECIES: hypothetical protein [unclassified Mesorhizobium]|nr:hypothetical protein [Mesorhizobium sp. LNHC252B00]ESY73466.1 hypothetical protein X743_11195 [Mesorhizobium sp. LNHC252B00]